MSNQHGNYTREVFPDQEESLSKIAAKIPAGSLVLDIGCGSGMLGKYLSEHHQCVVDGVDIDPEAIALAKPKHRKVGVFDLERERLTESFEAATYDCIVMADVIEHLVHPEGLFDDVKQLLKPDGILLFSIPNITHISAGLELVLGNFGYRENGLLDATHVRFYTRQGFVDTLAENGIYATEIDTVSRGIDETEFAAQRRFPRHWIEEVVQTREDALTYQWIITAQLFKPKRLTEVEATNLTQFPAGHLTFASRLYWCSTGAETGYSETNSIPGRVVFDQAQETVVVFEFTAENCRYPVTRLRLDPVNDQTVFLFRDATLLSSDHETIWSTTRLQPDDVTNAQVVSVNVDGQAVVFCESNDPQWHPQVDANALSAIKPGVSMRLRLALAPHVAYEALRDGYRNSLADVERHLCLLRSADPQSDQDELLETIQHESRDRAGDIENPAVNLQEKVNELAYLLARIAVAKNHSLREQQALVSQSQAQLDASRSELVQAQALAQSVQHEHQLRIDQIQSRLDESRDEVADKRVELAQAGAELIRVKSWAHGVQREYTKTLDSTSWRVTKPLRAVGTLIARKRRR